jgi:putative ABC transport system permease protein
MSKFLADLKYARRFVTRSPGFSAAAAATLALGIGANTAIFSVVYSVLLRPLPYPASERIVSVGEANEARHEMRLCDPNFRDMREQNRTLAAFAEHASWDASVSGGTEPVRATRAVVSRDFFAAMGVQPVLGRVFAEDEMRPGGTPAAIVSHIYWERYLSADRDLSRFPLRMDGDVYRIVGVMPRGFAFPEDAQVWTARERLDPEESRSAHNWSGVGRLRDGVSLASARADLSAIAARIRREHGDDADLASAAVSPLKDSVVGRVRPALLMLLSAVGFLMLVAAANVTNLSLARAASRRRELAVRAALGATRGDLFRAVFAETLVLSLAGATVGVFLCIGSLGLIRSLSGASLPRVAEISVDAPVFVFASLLSLAAAILVAAAASRRSPEAQQRDLAAGRSGQAGAVSRAQRILLGVQAAVTAVLLAGLALFARSFLRVLDVQPGFRAASVVAMDLFPPPAESDADKVARVEMIDRLLERLSAIRGVERTGAVADLPLASDLADGTFLLLGPQEPPPSSWEDFGRLAKDPERAGHADYAAVAGGYFETMGIPLKRGRIFDARDTRDSVHVALISETLARRRFAGRDPIGQRIEFGNMDGDVTPVTVVGIVGDVHHRSLEAAPEAVLYVNLRQRPQKSTTLTSVLRVASDPAAVMAAARGAVRDLDPTLPPRFRRLADVVTESMAARRFSLTLLALFGALALLLATSGIASLTAFAVARRRSELGIRLALGARPSDLLRLVVSSHLRIIGIGAAAGLTAAFLLARLLQSQLYGVAPTDPWSLVASLGILGAVGVAACALPARRVGRIQPTEALRAE